MPDWITHITVAWILCTVLGFRYKQFDTNNTVLVMVGAVIPDAVKIGMISDFLGYGAWDFILPLHMPAGALITTTMISLLFHEKKSAFLFLTLGLVTHFGLDLLLTSVSGGITIFYPFHWGQWQLNLISNVDYNINIIALSLALVVYLISWEVKKGRD